MTANQILEQARAKGIAITLERGMVAVSPASLLSAELRAAILENRSELIEVLRQDFDEGWQRMRRIATLLGKGVADGKKEYQLWGLTPIGAICFDGSALRTIALHELGY